MTIGTVAYLSLAPGFNGDFYYVHIPVAGREPGYPGGKATGELTLAYNRTGEPVGAAPGDCAGKSIAALRAAGQAQD